jgi:protein tyrosine/serine phosphatase
MTIEDFNALGFEYGDSVDVVFSNGYRLDDIPYYNGYYVDPGNPLLIGYPGYDYIKATVNYGQDLWDTANLKIGAAKEETLETGLWLNADLEKHDTASVYLHEKGKYLDIEQASDIHYKDERDQFPSDEVFANFRAVNMGNLKENVIYRSASPCDNQHKRAPYVNDLIEQAGVNAIMDLADTEVKIERYINADDFSSPYFLSLYEGGKVLPIGLNMNFYSEEFAAKTAKGFADLSKLETPYLIHCTEGKDRTGFVCMLVEMLAGSDYQAIVDDYMITYDNYYQITKEKDPVRYDVILQRNLIAMMKYVTGADEDGLKTADLAAAAEKYLLNAGMSEEDLASFKAKILK